MPNIIEQQDLLKGLPDARLAMLLQNPVADIPPFLVAAEAQRRQALRQQFSGDANKESVVDSLTKQLAKVPQNIQAPAQMPPAVPPTPQMLGVAALQAQQAVQQAAQQAVQPQAMAGGGMVQRYQAQGLVRPSVEGMSEAVTGGVGVEPVPELTFGDRVRRGFGYTYDWLMDPLGWQTEMLGGPPSEVLGLDPASVEANRRKVIEADKAKQLGEYYEMNLRDIEAAKRRAAPNKQITPAPTEQDKINQQEAQKKPEETEDQYRARLEALFAAQEPSDWEKAQRWFAMAEQFLDPSKTTMQSIAGAGQAFAESASEQARAQREMDLAREKAMLEYDMQIAERDRAAKIAERERTTLSANEYANVLIKSRDSLSDLITSKRKQLAELESNPTAPEEAKEALKSDLIANEKQFETISGQLAALGISAYGEVPYDVFSLSGGFKR
jgi:hypothetical protein